jgi:hypothetical protein
MCRVSKSVIENIKATGLTVQTGTMKLLDAE